MARKNAIRLYLTGTIGQITVIWICVMTHALINALSQISVGGNLFVSLVCKVIIICFAVFISGGICKDNEKRS